MTAYSRKKDVAPSPIKIDDAHIATMHSHLIKIICSDINAKQISIDIPANIYTRESIGSPKPHLSKRYDANSNPTVNGLSEASIITVASPAIDFRPFIIFHVHVW